uniref:Putative enoyl-coa hydratase n=1 Tax=Ixodes ricinus TaxID=34613 RepID=V5HAH5_IXORI
MYTALCLRTLLAPRKALTGLEVLKRRLASASYQHILVEKRGAQQNVALITLNRPKALNALCSPLMKELGDAIEELNKDSTVGAIVITGSEKAFAAGADIKEMQPLKFAQCFTGNFLGEWDESGHSLSSPPLQPYNGLRVGRRLRVWP